MKYQPIGTSISIWIKKRISGTYGLKFEDGNWKAIYATWINNLPSIRGGDCHNKDQEGRTFTELKNLVQTLNELIEEIRKGFVEEWPCNK